MVSTAVRSCFPLNNCLVTNRSARIANQKLIVPNQPLHGERLCRPDHHRCGDRYIIGQHDRCRPQTPCLDESTWSCIHGLSMSSSHGGLPLVLSTTVLGGCCWFAGWFMDLPMGDLAFPAAVQAVATASALKEFLGLVVHTATAASLLWVSTTWLLDHDIIVAILFLDGRRDLLLNELLCLLVSVRFTTWFRTNWKKTVITHKGRFHFAVKGRGIHRSGGRLLATNTLPRNATRHDLGLGAMRHLHQNPPGFNTRTSVRPNRSPFFTTQGDLEAKRLFIATKILHCGFPFDKCWWWTLLLWTICRRHDVRKVKLFL